MKFQFHFFTVHWERFLFIDRGKPKSPIQRELNNRIYYPEPLTITPMQLLPSFSFI